MTDTCEIYDQDSNSWKMGPRLSTPRRSMMSAVVKVSLSSMLKFDFQI